MQCVFEKSQTKASEAIQIIIFYLSFETVLLQNQFAVQKYPRVRERSQTPTSVEEIIRIICFQDKP